MGSAQLKLNHSLRQRLLAGYGGALAFGAAAAIAWWAFGLALTGAGLADAPFLLLAILLAQRLAALSVRTARWAVADPSVYVENDRLVIEEPTTLEGPQSIPWDLVRAVHVGPDVAGWMVGTYATLARSNETQLGRFPQLPNALILLNQPVYINQARPRMLRLWHLSAPPSPVRPTTRIWLTVDDHDAAFLVFADRGFDPAWATADNPLPVQD
jgi:hypothetical protein